MKEHAKYRIEGYCCPDDADKGYDSCAEADTIKEAKSKARYMLTEEHRKAAESTVPISLCRIMRVIGNDERDDECLLEIIEKNCKGRHFRAEKRDPDDEESPTNGERANHAEKSLYAFLQSTGEPRHIDDDAVRDLMADLLHWCDRNGANGSKIMATAKRDWRAER